MLTITCPAASPTQLRALARLDRILRNAARAKLANPRNAGLATGVTITDTGATLPAAVSPSNGALITGNPAVDTGIWTVGGGKPLYVSYHASGNLYAFPSAYIAATGGTVGLNTGANNSCWRVSARAVSRYFAAKLRPTTVPYRVLVDGRYVSTAGTTLGTTSGSTPQYLLLDFGSRATRVVTIEGQAACGFGGAFVEATGKLWPDDRADTVRASFIGDSYVYGSAATALGDGIAPVLGDWLGAVMQASGSGGTGWVADAGGTAYRFDERIANGDIALGGTAPDILFLMASVNDRTSSAATVTANALAGLGAARALYPDTPIVVFGCAGASYVANVLANEAAVQAAVTQFADPLCAFVPVSTDAAGAWVSGSGKAGSTAGDGISDWATASDGTHPTDEGAAMLGRRYAMAALAALEAMYSAY